MIVHLTLKAHLIKLAQSLNALFFIINVLFALECL